MTNRLNVPTASTHKGYILYSLLSGKHIRNKGMYHELDTCFSSSRISELRSDGWDISDKYMHMVTKEGKEVRVKEYFIKRDEILSYKKADNVIKFLEACDRIYSKSA